MKGKQIKSIIKEALSSLKSKKLLTEQVYQYGDSIAQSGQYSYSALGLDKTNPCHFLVDSPNGDVVLLSGYFSTTGIDVISNLCQGVNGQQVMGDPSDPINVAGNQPPFFVPDGQGGATQAVSLFDFIDGLSPWLLANWADRCGCDSYPLFDNGIDPANFDNNTEPTLTFPSWQGGPGPLPYNPNLFTGGIDYCESQQFEMFAPAYCQDGNTLNSAQQFTQNQQIQDMLTICCPGYNGTNPTFGLDGYPGIPECHPNAANVFDATDYSSSSPENLCNIYQAALVGNLDPSNPFASTFFNNYSESDLPMFEACCPLVPGFTAPTPEPEEEEEEDTITPDPVVPDPTTLGGLKPDSGIPTKDPLKGPIKPGTSTTATPLKGKMPMKPGMKPDRKPMREQVERMQKLANISKKILKEQFVLGSNLPGPPFGGTSIETLNEYGLDPGNPCDFIVTDTANGGYTLLSANTGTTNAIQAISNLCNGANGYQVTADPNNSMNVDINQPPFYLPDPNNPGASTQQQMSLNDLTGGSMPTWKYADWASRCGCTSYPVYSFEAGITYENFVGGPGPLPYNPNVIQGGIDQCESEVFTSLANNGVCEGGVPYLSGAGGSILQGMLNACCPEYLASQGGTVTPDPVTPDLDTMGGVKPGSGIPTLTPGKGPAKPPISTTATPMKGKMMEPKKAPMRKPMREQVERMQKLANIKKKK